MRLVLVFFCLFFAAPAMAQADLCRGKPQFKLEDGASGCLVEISTGTIKRTLNRSDNDFSRTSKINRPQLNVLMFGQQDTNRPAVVRRARAICSFLQPELQKQGLSTGGSNSMMMFMIWPGQRETVQGATMSKTCRSVRYLRVQ